MSGKKTIAQQYFDKLVLISNSVPKSGSTYLHALQTRFLSELTGATADYDSVAQRGVKSLGSFIYKPQEQEFIDFITDPDITGGPYIFKIHAIFNDKLAEAITSHQNIFASLAIRDPLEIFFSARDNFKKTGEFSEFETTEKAVNTINGYFTKIAASAFRLGQKKQIPVVRYEQLMTDPISALQSSLATEIQTCAMRLMMEKFTDFERASNDAVGRRNRAVIDRTSSEDQQEVNFLVTAIEESRRAFGYIK